MASSRRSAPRADSAEEAAVLAAVRTCVADEADPKRPVVVAFSGGLDSTVLLEAAVRVFGPERCLAAHVHHGLQAAADDWPGHCAGQAQRLGVRFECLRLEGAPSTGDSLEQWARDRRYRALAALAHQVDATRVLTAHHLDDQIETLLIRIARGTGIDGLTGIRGERLLEGVVFARPFLRVSRAALAHCGRAWACRWVEDPSNLDTDLLRNAIRHRLLPVLDEIVPDFGANLVRLSGHLDSARRAVSDLAALDLARARGTAARRSATGRCPESAAIGALVREELDPDALAALPSHRRHGALRAWIASKRLPPPTERRLMEIDRQLLRTESGRGEVRHAGVTLRRELGRVFVDLGTVSGFDVPAEVVRLHWRGEASIALPMFGGRLCFDPVASEPGPAGSALPGVSGEWLRTVPLAIGRPTGRARLRPTVDGRARTLKNLYQEARVPASSRRRLPSVLVGERVLYAGGLGMDRSPDWPRAGSRVALSWEPDAGDEPAVV